MTVAASSTCSSARDASQESIPPTLSDIGITKDQSSRWPERWREYESRKRAFDLTHPGASPEARDQFIAQLAQELGL